MSSSTTVPIKTLDGIPIRTLFVGNVHKEATEKELRACFSSYGAIVTASVVPSHAQSRSEEKKCTFGFLTFKDPLDAARALKLSGSIKLKKRTLFLNPADSWHQPIERPDGNLVFQMYERLDRAPAPVTNNEEIEEEEDDADIVDLNSDCLINSLVDDCLRVIFDYVGVEFHHVLSRVCRRWRMLMFEYWDKLTVLDLSSPPLSQVHMNDNSIKTYFSLCKNLDSVVLDQQGHRITSQSIATAAVSVPNLRGLSLVNFSLVQRPLSVVAQRCPNLEKFSMKDCDYKHDNEITPLLKRCRNLQSLSFTNCPYHSGSWLAQLNPPLSSLSIINCSINFPAFPKCLTKLAPSLKELVVIFKMKVTLVLPELPNLEKLILGSILVVSRCPTTYIKGLKHLELFRTEIANDAWIRTIVEQNPELEALNISGSLSSLTVEGYDPLTQLEKLKHLNLSNLACVTDAVLEKFCKKDWKLVSLKLRNCCSITDEGCKRLVTEMRHLSYLDLTGCCKVTAATFRAANKASLADPTKQPLTLVMEGLDIEDWSPSNVTLYNGSEFEGPIIWNAGCKDATILDQMDYDDIEDDYADLTDDDDDVLYDIDDDLIFGEDIDDDLLMRNIYYDDDDDDDSDTDYRRHAFLMDHMDDAIIHFLM